MTEERDPTIQALFAQADQELSDETFTADLMERIQDNKQRKTLLGAAVGLVGVLCAWLFAAPLQSALNLITQGLAVSLFELENAWLAFLLTPLNNVATLVGGALLLLWLAYRKLFAR